MNSRTLQVEIQVEGSKETCEIFYYMVDEKPVVERIEWYDDAGVQQVLLGDDIPLETLVEVNREIAIENQPYIEYELDRIIDLKNRTDEMRFDERHDRA